MERYRLGNLVRIDIPDELDADHRWHGENGIIIDVVHTRAGFVYEVGLERYPMTLVATEMDIRPPFKQFNWIIESSKIGNCK